MFSVSGTRLTRRQTISSGGTFPVSVTTHGDLVYVLNARDGGVLQGYLRTGEHLKRIAVWRRTLGLNPAATPEFVSTPGQVTFNPAGTALVVTTKANGNMLQVFRVDGTRGLSGAATVTTDTGNVPFAGVFDAHGRLVLAEAGDNAVATYDLARNGAASLVARAATGQQATCWIVRAGSHVYLSNAASGTLSAYAVSPTGKLTAKGTTATDAGTVDAAVSPGGHFLYVQTGAKGIVDEFRIGARGHLTRIGAVTVPGAVGGEGIAAS